MLSRLDPIPQMLQRVVFRKTLGACSSPFATFVSFCSKKSVSSAFIRGQFLSSRLSLCLAVLIAILFTSLAAALPVQAQETDAKLREQATAAMRKAADYYKNKVALHGGYVYYYSPDLKLRHGEGPATATQIWVQPPGTPTVGLAYLAAYKATGDKFYLDAAREAGESLIYGQLKSGGWQNCIDFDPKGRVNLYRNGKGGGQNNSTLDDNISQSAIQFMSKLDEALEFKDPKVHESATIALNALLKAQFANGAFPQVWTGPVPQVEVKKTSFPNYDYRTEGKVKDYWNMYTLNDGLAGTVSDTLLTAEAVYKDSRYRDALAKLGDFLILAQMPDPQPAWAQQYSRDMQPIWARRFEPAAITGGESQDVIETLMKIYRHTGDKKYLEPIPRALAHLKKSLLPDGRLARYYEMKTNKPLYMNRANGEYFLTFDDKDLPDHYGWKVDSRLDTITSEYKALAATGKSLQKEPTISELREQAKQIASSLDSEGRWISTYAGERLAGQPKFKTSDKYLNSDTFSTNLEALSAFLTAKK
jgi:PelA/Pel-15E family pectate lyase